MPLRTRTLAAVIAAVVVGLALMANDRARDAWWKVTAAQIADARASGKPGIELIPGQFITEPVPVDGVLWLPVKWVLGGMAAGFAVLAVTGRRIRM